MVLIGNNVRHYRMERKMTQEELASLVNKNSSAITRIEGGQRMMSVPMLRAVAVALDTSCDALIHNGDRSVRIANICNLLSGQSDQSLAHLQKLIRVCITEYGDEKENSLEVRMNK